METFSRTEALDIFQDNLEETIIACQENLKAALNKLDKPDVANCDSYQHWWVKANLYQLKREKIIDQYQPSIRSIQIKTQPPTEGTVQEIDIEKAKEYLIHDLLGTQGKKGNISCPFHQDRTPSFQIKKDNTFTCYSCGEYGDAIDLYQKLNNCDFIHAVKALS